MSDSRRPFVGVVLTGGQSTRMGRDKARIELDGVPMAVRAARTLQEAGAVAVFGVGGDPEGLATVGLRTIPDRWPGAGPLGGVITALEGAEGADVVVLSCDTPFVSAATVRALVEGDDAADVVAATTPAQEHLLVARYAARCLSTLRARFDDGERAVHRAARELRRATVLVDDHEVFNLNSPSDLSDAERRAARPGGPIDRRGRPLADLRLSVTDRCNLRCSYCMPEQTYNWLPRDEILTFEEIGRLVDAFVELGVRKVRLTGGEPLLRKGLPELVALLADKPPVDDLAMTTNGVLLAEHTDALRTAGLGRVTVSLDTLRPDRFEQLSRRSTHDAVLRGLRAVTDAGFTDTKIDTVVLRGINDDELVDLVEFAATVPAEVRFVEYMDVGGATRWNAEAVVSRDEMLATLAAHFGPITPLPGRPAAPADRYQLPDGTAFGIIASTTAPFCAACDRSRVTADGMWFGCLYAPGGTDLRSPLRAGAGLDELQELITGIWTRRSDQGAVERNHERARGPVFPVALLQRDPHLEMHTRGG